FSEAQQADYAILKGEGYTDNEAIRFVQELEKKVNEEKPEAWAASYSMAIVQGMTEEEAENFANGRHSNYASQRLQGGQKKKLLQQANVPRGVYYYLALEKHGENTALELSKVYEQ
ncbi:hypothetical protein GWN63_03675, partial [Candidatus Bathyarchaeota archaeon]|nr:hypothetical protein [Desulfobacterales bacterium]NIU81330.1 hypothetical protein [Candidatus Bathyarchaeota archaeon]NIV67973.1 hypothetical protein [Candidatus Bathyarchaeota archaeon]NIW34517.1 hypothetical protein [Candidatus Bathyarchaeota archaeon]